MTHYPFPPPLFEGQCIKTTSDLVPPKINSIGGKPAAKNKAAAPSFNYAIVEVEVNDFDPAYPPKIKLFDDTDNVADEPLETLKFAPNRSAPCPPLKTLGVPVFLAYDSDPWSRPNKEPAERITRIELHHGSFVQPITAYVKLKAGIFVVPVYWHNVVNLNGVCHVDPIRVMELFWTIPTGLHHDDVNSIWAQAGVQFRLMNTGIPFHFGSIPTHVVGPMESTATGCVVGWSQNFNSDTGVDIYTVQSLGPAGIGNCFGQGYVLIKAANPDSAQPGFSDPVWNAQGRAELVAHEFGHYLSALPHKDIYNNLMHSMLGGWELEKLQIDLARKRIKDRGTFNASV